MTMKQVCDALESENRDLRKLLEEVSFGLDLELGMFRDKHTLGYVKAWDNVHQRIKKALAIPAEAA